MGPARTRVSDAIPSSRRGDEAVLSNDRIANGALTSSAFGAAATGDRSLSGT